MEQYFISIKWIISEYLRELVTFHFMNHSEKSLKGDIFGNVAYIFGYIKQASSSPLRYNQTTTLYGTINVLR